MDNSSLIALDLSQTSVETIKLFMDETSDDSVFQEIFDVNQSRADVLRLLLEHPYTPDIIRAATAGLLSLPVPSSDEVAIIRASAEKQKAGRPVEQKKQRLLQTVQRLSVSEKVKLAMKGNGEARGVLIRDSNKLVILSVLDNPRLTDSEVVTIARNRSIIEEALRVVSKNREWMKNYAVQLALVTNPKTPPGISMKYIAYLKSKDLKLLEKNKNVPEAVRAMSKKFNKKNLK